VPAAADAPRVVTVDELPGSYARDLMLDGARCENAVVAARRG
jgi:hypothetical protein